MYATGLTAEILTISPALNVLFAVYVTTVPVPETFVIDEDFPGKEYSIFILSPDQEAVTESTSFGGVLSTEIGLVGVAV